MMIIDCRGQQCPQPVIQVRRQLLAEPQQPLQVLVDDAAARDNIGKLAASRGCSVTVTSEGVAYRLLLTPGEAGTAAAGVPAVGPTVVLVAAEQMGHGDDQLGRILLKNFFFTLAENDTAPDLLLFVNGGARLTAAGSELVEALRKLTELGSDIATCGLCLDFFGLKEQLAVGRVTNMLEIATALQTAGRVIRP
jgi:selenium metabolism protein YedF